jgi:RNA polymerase sigma-70 factor (ECF subfamily)
MELSRMLHTDPGVGAEDAARAAAQEVALVTRARRGDEDAWTTLVRYHQEPVFRLVYLMLGNDQDTAAQAEDVTQETFVRAYLKLDQFEVGRSLRSWLLAIGANLARNRQRSVGRYWAAIRRWWQAQGTEKAMTAPTQDERDDAQVLWQAIRRLSKAHQQTLYLRYFLDMSELEMAQVLDVAAGTVKSRHYRARQALQTALKEEFPTLYDEWQKR